MSVKRFFNIVQAEDDDEKRKKKVNARRGEVPGLKKNEEAAEVANQGGQSLGDDVKANQKDISERCAEGVEAKSEVIPDKGTQNENVCKGKEKNTTEVPSDQLTNALKANRVTGEEANGDAKGTRLAEKDSDEAAAPSNPLKAEERDSEEVSKVKGRDHCSREDTSGETPHGVLQNGSSNPNRNADRRTVERGAPNEAPQVGEAKKGREQQMRSNSGETTKKAEEKSAPKNDTRLSGGDYKHHHNKESHDCVNGAQKGKSEGAGNKCNPQGAYNNANGGSCFPQNWINFNGYYDMYGCGYAGGAGMPPATTVPPMAPPGMINMVNAPNATYTTYATYTTNTNHVNYNNYYYYQYNYNYYGMCQDYNRGMEKDMGGKPYEFSSLLEKSIQLMKKNDKVKEILKRPAKLQVTQEELNKVEYLEGNDQYNIWFGKYVPDKFDKGSSTGSSSGVQRFVARFKCNPSTDSGYTKADKNLTSKQFFCIYFARGCCAYGHNCLYRHRIPNENDELQFEQTIDIFGREKFSTFKEDMGGVGNFNSECRTLFIGSIHIDNFEQVHLIEKILYDEFSNFGNIEYVRYVPFKNIAFVQYSYRVNAEFAKVAMSDQPIENHSTALTIKWAFELKNTPHHSFQHYANPYVYNQSPLVSSTWKQYTPQQFSSPPQFGVPHQFGPPP
ncbi:Uncharacterized protein PCOAH_00030140 [Plasmodium coatneyi]|uniref:Pre-mRNA-splicing factor CWC2 n=1 Tax=Plasmodium coatneyi TaxID=208452 RepID=A0A1B1E1C1_9APIC|nr:Uncharacterized protein PCOAH_00030140 [Plasmodium coatneyi]ANQ08675.1 Uncharacterized protein PCOAH_00030140 [Plasmodium coatneyi]